MNSLPPLSLPRFHVNALSQARNDKTTAMPGLRPEDEFDVPSELPSDELDSDADQPAETPEPVAAMPQEIDTGEILNSLEAAIAGLERTALTHSQAIVSEFLRAAFPKLCECFLAEEVAAATNAMSPSDIERLSVIVPAAFEPSFQRAIHASSRMTEICDLQTRPDGPILVDVDWGAGGLQFDMDQFFEASLARLSGSVFTQEGQDV